MSHAMIRWPRTTLLALAMLLVWVSLSPTMTIAPLGPSRLDRGPGLRPRARRPEHPGSLQPAGSPSTASREEALGDDPDDDERALAAPAASMAWCPVVRLAPPSLPPASPAPGTSPRPLRC